MQSFLDSTGQPWNIAVTYGDVQKIKAQLGCDLLNLSTKSGESPLERLMVDIELIVGIGWLVCEKEATTRGVSPDDFASRLGGTAIGELHRAVLADIADFFRGLGRTEIAGAIAKLHKAVADLIEKTREKVEAVDLIQISKT